MQAEEMQREVFTLFSAPPYDRMNDKEKLQRLEEAVLSVKRADSMRKMRDASNGYEALDWAQKIVEYDRKAYGKDSCITLEDRQALARCYLNAGEFLEANDLFRELSAQCGPGSGVEERIVLRLLRGEGEALTGMKRYRKAKRILERVLERQDTVFGADDRDTLETSHRLALLLARSGRKKAALSLAEKTYLTQRRVLGQAHPDTLASRLLLLTLKPYGSVHEQEEEMDRFHSFCRNTLGEGDSVTLEALFNHAVIISKQREYLQAALECDDCSELYELHGYTHPVCMKIVLRQSGFWRKAGDHHLARVSFEMYLISLQWKCKNWLLFHLIRLLERIEAMKRQR